MKRREKIILLLALGAVVFYAVDVLFLPATPKPAFTTATPGERETAAFVIDMGKSLAKADTSETDAYIVTRAAAKWRADPFLRSEFPIEAEAATESVSDEVQVVPFIYSGYLAIGDRKLAVISGMEYEIGDVLGQGGYRLQAISPTQVTIGNMVDKNYVSLKLDEGNAGFRKPQEPGRP